MPNNLSETARRAYQRRRVYVPEWMQLAQWVAIALIPVVLLISFAVDSNEPLRARDNLGSESLPTSTATNTTAQTGRMVSLPSAVGEDTDVPAEALEVAQQAGLALWTGNWAEVAVDGPTPVTEAVYPNARLGRPNVYSSDDNAIVFVFPLDGDADGVMDQTFQISVVSIDGAWRFPSAVG